MKNLINLNINIYIQGEQKLKNQVDLGKDNNIKLSNKLKIKDMIVEIEYSQNSKTFSECMIDVLKHKNRI